MECTDETKTPILSWDPAPDPKATPTGTPATPRQSKPLFPRFVRAPAPEGKMELNVLEIAVRGVFSAPGCKSLRIPNPASDSCTRTGRSFGTGCPFWRPRCPQRPGRSTGSFYPRPARRRTFNPGSPMNPSISLDRSRAFLHPLEELDSSRPGLRETRRGLYSSAQSSVQSVKSRGVSPFSILPGDGDSCGRQRREGPLPPAPPR